MTTKYIARLDGRIVGKRSSNRVYTHAVVAQKDVAHYRDAAYNYVATSSDRSNFDHEVEVAACEGTIVEVPHYEPKKVAGQRAYKLYDGTVSYLSYDAEDIADAKATVALGWDGYVAKLRSEAIARFEQKLADGYFNPVAFTWCGRPDLAEKAKASHWKLNNCSAIWIVPAEKVTK